VKEAKEMRISGKIGRAEEGRDINTQIKGGETLKKQLAVIIGAILAISAVAVIPYCLAGAAISGGWVFYGNDDGHLHGLANVSRYDFRTGAGEDKWAFRNETSATLSVNVPNIEFTTAQYEKINTSDDTWQEDQTSQDGYYAAHRFNFSIIEDASDIRKINVTWEGRGWHDSATDGATLYIYNFTSGAYEQLDSTTLDTEVTLTGEKTSSISSYINSGNVTILVNQTSAQIYDEEEGVYRRSHIETDYVKLELHIGE